MIEQNFIKLFETYKIVKTIFSNLVLSQKLYTLHTCSNNSISKSSGSILLNKRFIKNQPYEAIN